MEWEQALHTETETLGIRKTVPAVISDAVQTPLSIGIFSRSKRIVLPDRHYEPEDLTLIFRHELLHLAREDCSTKLLLVLTTSLLWWNPLSWHARKRCAEDLELACDETAVGKAPYAERERYTELLLKTAGDERGFTSCLSASAASLHYRLRSVLHPKQKSNGTLLTACIIFLLFFTFGQVGFAYHPQNALDVMQELSGQPLDAFDRVAIGTGRYPDYRETDLEPAAREALYELFVELNVYEMAQDLSSSEYIADDADTSTFYWHAGPKDWAPGYQELTVTFYPHCVQMYYIECRDTGAVENPGTVAGTFQTYYIFELPDLSAFGIDN